MKRKESEAGKGRLQRSLHKWMKVKAWERKISRKGKEDKQEGKGRGKEDKQERTDW